MSKRVKRIMRYMTATVCLLLMGAMLAFAGETGAGSEPRLNKASLSLTQFAAEQLKVEGGNEAVQWKSLNPKIASVSAGGRVTALQAGKAKIAAVVGGRRLICVVRVSRLQFTQKRLTIARNRAAQLTLNNPAVNAVWRSSNKGVATVTQKGVLVGVRKGKCTITAKYRGVTCSIKVTVRRTSAGNLGKTYQKNAANEGRILLLGSSSVDYWSSAASAFSPYKILNMGIAGSKTVQWIKWYQKLVTDYKPSAVVIYVGSNDIRRGNSTSGEKNAKNSQKLIQLIREKLPEVPIFYVSICHVWSRTGGWTEVDRSNELMEAYCKTARDVYYINLLPYMMDSTGLPDLNLFRADRIHPNAKGYQVWNKVIGGTVKRVMDSRSSQSGGSALISGLPEEIDDMEKEEEAEEGRQEERQTGEN